MSLCCFLWGGSPEEKSSYRNSSPSRYSLYQQFKLTWVEAKEYKELIFTYKKYKNCFMYAIERAKQKWCVSLYIPLFSYRVITKIQ